MFEGSEVVMDLIFTNFEKSANFWGPISIIRRAVVAIMAPNADFDLIFYILQKITTTLPFPNSIIMFGHTETNSS